MEPVAPSIIPLAVAHAMLWHKFDASRGNVCYRATTMFVRYRQTESTVQASLIVGRRTNGRVQHEQLASLGSIKQPLTVESRDEFWLKLHDTLARLSNRIDTTAITKILANIHARIPMVTNDERTAHAIELAEHDQRIWDGMRGMFEGAASDMAALANKANAASTEGRKQAAEATANSAEAKERIERLQRGEAVAASKPVDFERILREAVMTTGDIQHMRLLADLPKDLLPTVRDEAIKASHRAERATVRRLHRQRSGQ
jgi:hypothetical protein